MKKSMQEIHEEIYQYLMECHRADDGFRFRLLEDKKSSDCKAIWEGFYFAGNESKVMLSFWAVDLENNHDHRYAIEFVIEPYRNLWYCCISNPSIDLDDEEEQIFMENMVKGLEGYEQQKKGVWEKFFKEETYLKALQNFINTDKKLIDKYIKENIYDSEPQDLSTSVVAEPMVSTTKKKKKKKKRKWIVAEEKLSQDLREDLKNKPSCYLEKTKISLPFALKHILKISNFQGIKNASIFNLPLDAQFIFLTGENGYGKTSILRALTVGMEENAIVHNLSYAENNISLIINSNNKEHFLGCDSGSRHGQSTDILLAAYGTSRFMLNSSSDEGKFATLMDDKSSLLGIETLMKDANEEEFEKIKSVLLSIIPNLHEIKVEYEHGYKKVFYREKDEQGEIFESVTLNQLAAGYRNVINMIGDLIFRWRRDITEKPFAEMEGIVIIDEFDAHLHPKYQYELPQLLSKAFPKVQFIVSTHSPIPILGAPKDKAVVLTVNRTREKGITIERMDNEIDIEQLTVNSLLSSDIFGDFNNIASRDASPEVISPFNSYDKVKEMTDLEKLIMLKNGLLRKEIEL